MEPAIGKHGLAGDGLDTGPHRMLAFVKQSKSSSKNTTSAWILFLFPLGLVIFLITLTVALPLGILTCNSAGNSGVVGSITNFAPWSFTVAATTMDRTFQGKLVMGNNKTLSVNSVIDILSVLFPLCCYL
jgi:hypothetical protein